MSKAQIQINNTLPEVQVRCSHPSYSDEAKKLKKPRRVNNQVSEEIYQEFQASVPIESGT